MSKPRVLIVENSIAITGALTSIIRSCQGLANEYDFTFLMPQNSTGVKLVQQSGFTHFEIPMREIRKDTLSVIQYLPVLFYNTWKFSALVNRLKIDLIVVNDFYNMVPSAYRIFGGKVPYVCYVRFLPSRFPKALVKTWCVCHQRYAEATIAVSQAVKGELDYKANVVVIGNELPLEQIEFTPAKHVATILYPANYIRGKGQEYALKSWAKISKKHPQWKLRFVGGDMGLAKNKNYKEELMELCTQLELKSSVEWSDFSNKISDEYLSSAIVLNFSESESFSMTCLEAMFYGRPVIATRSGGPSEIIDHDRSGILVDVADVKAMAEALDMLLTDGKRREAMARIAYDSVRQKFSFQNTIQRVGEVLKRALQNSA